MPPVCLRAGQACRAALSGGTTLAKLSGSIKAASITNRARDLAFLGRGHVTVASTAQQQAAQVHDATVTTPLGLMLCGPLRSASRKTGRQASAAIMRAS